MFKVFLAPKSPRLVIMNVYEGNDLRDAIRYHAHAAGQGDRADEQAGDREARSVRNALGRASYAYNLAATGIVALREALFAERRVRRDRPEKDVDFRYRLELPGGAIAFNADNNDRDEVVFARQLIAGEVSTALFDKALADFMALSRSNGFQALVIYSPSAYTAYARYVRFADPELQSLMPSYSETLRRYFAEGAERFGYRFLDLTPLLQEEIARTGGSPLLYFPRNVHYTSAGSRVIAERLARELRDLLK